MDNYDIKLRVDTSDLTMGAEQAKMQALSAAYSSAGMLSPQMAMAQQTFGAVQLPPAGMMTAGTTGPYGGSIISPRVGAPGSYNYPYGMIPGSPVRTGGTGTLISDMATGYGNWALQGFSNSVAGRALGQVFPSISSLGIISGPLDLPMYKAQQMFGERMGENFDALKTNVAKFGLGGMIGAAGLGAAFLPMGASIPLGTAALAAGSAADFMFETRQKMMETGNFYGDAMAPVMHSRLGGGADYHDRAQFVKGFGRKAGADQYFTNDDYQSVLQIGTDLGFLESARTPEAGIQAIDNIAKSFKSALAMGTKLKELHTMGEQARLIGIDLAGSGTTTGQYLGAMGFNAFSANMGTTQMMAQSGQAGQLFAQQGIAPVIGARIHGQNMANVAEGVRYGAYSIADQAYYGGQENMSANLTQAMATVNRTPVGQLLTMNMMKDPKMMEQVASGKMDFNQLISSGGLSMSPEEYTNMQYRMPDFTKDMDPNSMGMGQVATYLNSIKNVMGGGKLNPGTAHRVLMNMGMSPDQARLVMKQIENSDEIAAGGMESLNNKATQLLLEAQRPAATIFSNPRLWLQNKMESTFNPQLSDWAGASLEDIGHMEHTWEGRLMGRLLHPEMQHTVHLQGNVKGVEAGLNLMHMARQGTSREYEEEFERDVAERKKEILTEELRRTYKHGFKSYGPGDINYGVNDLDSNTFIGKEANRIRDERRTSFNNINALFEQSSLEDVDPNYRRTGTFRLKEGPSVDKDAAPVSSATVDKVISDIEKNGSISPEQYKLLRAGLQSPDGISMAQRQRLMTAQENIELTDKEIDRLGKKVWSDNTSRLTAEYQRGIEEPNAAVTKAVNERMAMKSPDELKANADQLVAVMGNKGLAGDDVIVTAARQVLGDATLSKADVERIAEHEPEKLNMVAASISALSKRRDLDEGTREKLRKFNTSVGKISSDAEGDVARKIEDQLARASKSLRSEFKTQTGLNIDVMSGRHAGFVRARLGEQLFSEKGLGDAGRDINLLGESFDEFVKGNADLTSKWASIKQDAASGKDVSEDYASFMKAGRDFYFKEKREFLGADDDGKMAELDRQIAESVDVSGKTKATGKMGTGDFYAKAGKAAGDVERLGGKDIVAKRGLMGKYLKEMKEMLGGMGIESDVYEQVLVKLGDGTTAKSDDDVKQILEDLGGKKGSWYKLGLDGKNAAATGGYDELAKATKQVLELREKGDSTKDTSLHLLQSALKKTGARPEDIEKAGSLVSQIYQKDSEGKFVDSAGSATLGIFGTAVTGKLGTDKLVTGGADAKSGYLDKEQTAGMVQAAKQVTANLQIAQTLKDTMQDVPRTLEEFSKQNKESLDKQAESFEKLNSATASLKSSADQLAKITSDLKNKSVAANLTTHNTTKR